MGYWPNAQSYMHGGRLLSMSSSKFNNHSINHLTWPSHLDNNILMHKCFQQFYHSGFGRSKRFKATQINQFGLDPQVPAPAKRDTAPGVKKVKMVGDSCIFSQIPSQHAR